VRDRGLVPELREVAVQHARGVDVVVDDEHAHPLRQPRHRLGAPLAARLGRAGGARERHGERAPGAGPIARGGDRAAVELAQVARDRQADAEPALRAIDRALALDEHLEQLRQQLRRDPRPAVADLDDDRLAGIARRDVDRRVRTAVLRCVDQEVLEHLREPDRIGIDEQPLARHVDRQRLLLLLDQRRCHLDRAGDHGRQLEDLLRQVEPAAPCARGADG
jgi:hypothetical protein